MSSRAGGGGAAGTPDDGFAGPRGPAEDGPAAKSDGRQARWQRHNESRRQQIIDAAVEVIAEGHPGAELHVQQVANRAGVNRTVVYRYFEDRDDLDHAIQQAIVAQLWARLMPAVTLEGTVPQIIERIIGTYVDWAVSNPALHYVVDHDYGSGALEQALNEIATAIGSLVWMAMQAFGGALEFDEAQLDPLAHGLVGSVFGVVRRWLNRPHRTLSAEQLRETISKSVWFVIEGHARAGGVVLDPDLPLADLLAAAGGDIPPATVAP